MSISTEQAQQHCEAFLEKYPGLTNLKILIFPSSENLPPLSENFAGGFLRGKDHLLVLSDNVDGPEQLERLLRHETFAHYAFDSLDPQARQKFYTRVTEALLADPEFKQHYLETLGGRYTTAGITPDNIEEYFAVLAETEQELSFSKQLIAFIRDLMHEMFPKIASIIGYNEDDARFFLQRTMEGIATGSIVLKSNNEQAAAKNNSFIDKHGLAGLSERVRIVGEKNASPNRSISMGDEPSST